MRSESKEAMLKILIIKTLLLFKEIRPQPQAPQVCAECTGMSLCSDKNTKELNGSVLCPIVEEGKKRADPCRTAIMISSKGLQP